MVRLDVLFIQILQDDGYAQGDVYPKGSWRPKEGVQRGSVMDMPVYPGDPLTPGVGATKDAKRLDRKDAMTIMKIPVLPISYEDALPFFNPWKVRLFLHPGEEVCRSPIMPVRVTPKSI